MSKAKAKAEAPKAEVQESAVCSICGVTADDVDLHTAWHESQQARYTELLSPDPGVDGTVLFAPPVEEPEPVPLEVTWTDIDPNAAPDEQSIIHVPK